MRTAVPETCSVDGCDHPHYARGVCNKHYQAARSRGLLPRRTAEQMYEAKIDRTNRDGCHPWTGSISQNNQAKFTHDGETLAVRWGYKRLVGSLADDEVVRHTCDNGICCNPLHWVKGTQVDNVRDCIERDRHARGERNANSVLTEAQVREIRRLYAGRTDYQVIARRYGVGPHGVRSVLIGRTWKHVA